MPLTFVAPSRMLIGTKNPGKRVKERAEETVMSFSIDLLPLTPKGRRGRVRLAAKGQREQFGLRAGGALQDPEGDPRRNLKAEISPHTPSKECQRQSVAGKPLHES